MEVVVLYEVMQEPCDHSNVFWNPDVSVDGDDPEHVQWIYKQALQRSEEYKIKGVTYRLTQGRKRLLLYMDILHVI